MTVLESPLGGHKLADTKGNGEEQGAGVRWGHRQPGSTAAPKQLLRKHLVSHNPAIYRILFCPAHDIHVGTSLIEVSLPSTRREITWKENEIQTNPF